jgi:hypothetical protein
VAKAGLAHAVLPLAQIGARVLKLLDPHAAGGR